LNYGSSFVLAVVIHEDDFEAAQRLGQDALDRFRQECR